MIQVIPETAYADFEKVLEVLPEEFYATVRVFNGRWHDEKSFEGDSGYSIDNLILRMESPTKAKILALVKDDADRENERQCRKIEEGEEIAQQEQKNIYTLDKATWYIGDIGRSNLRIELDRWKIEIFYYDAESANAAKEIFDKLYDIPSLNIKINKHKWHG